MDIKPYEKNAKKHSPEQIFKIALSVKNFGWRQPIVVDNEGVIVVGHGRWFAYEQYKEEMGLPEPVVEVAKDLNEEQIKAYRLTDNLVASSDYDMDLVEAESRQLSMPFQEILRFEDVEETKKDQEYANKITDDNYNKYLTQSIRQIVCLYKGETYKELLEKCQKLQEKFGLENNSELFEKLVNDSYETIQVKVKGNVRKKALKRDTGKDEIST